MAMMSGVRPPLTVSLTSEPAASNALTASVSPSITAPIKESLRGFISISNVGGSDLILEGIEEKEERNLKQFATHCSFHNDNGALSTSKQHRIVAGITISIVQAEPCQICHIS